MSNYPAGANIPSAPWNRPEPDAREWIVTTEHYVTAYTEEEAEQEVRRLIKGDDWDIAERTIEA